MSLFLAQAVAGPQLPSPPRPRSDAPCPVVTDTSDVVVCGRSNDAYRLRPLPARLDREGLPRAEARVFGDAKVSLDAEQAGDGHGGSIDRAMVRLKIPLGAKRRPPAP